MELLGRRYTFRSQRMKAHHVYIPNEFLALIGQRVRELKSYYGEDNKITIYVNIIN